MWAGAGVVGNTGSGGDEKGSRSVCCCFSPSCGSGRSSSSSGSGSGVYGRWDCGS